MNSAGAVAREQVGHLLEFLLTGRDPADVEAYLDTLDEREQRVLAREAVIAAAAFLATWATEIGVEPAEALGMIRDMIADDVDDEAGLS